MDFSPILSQIGQVSIYVFLSLVIFAAVTDLVELIIPNWLVATCIVMFIIAASVYQIGWENLIWSFVAMILTLIVSMLLWSLGFMGGGDSKLLAVIALWYGWSSTTIEFFGVMAIAGGALGIVLMILHAFPLPLWMYRLKGIPQFRQKRPSLPYGIAIAIGAIFVFQQSKWYVLALI